MEHDKIILPNSHKKTKGVRGVVIGVALFLLALILFIMAVGSPSDDGSKNAVAVVNPGYADTDFGRRCSVAAESYDKMAAAIDAEAKAKVASAEAEFNRIKSQYATNIKSLEDMAYQYSQDAISANNEGLPDYVVSQAMSLSTSFYSQADSLKRQSEAQQQSALIPATTFVQEAKVKLDTIQARIDTLNSCIEKTNAQQQLSQKERTDYESVINLSSTKP